MSNPIMLHITLFTINHPTATWTLIICVAIAYICAMIDSFLLSKQVKAQKELIEAQQELIAAKNNLILAKVKLIETLKVKGQ